MVHIMIFLLDSTHMIFLLDGTHYDISIRWYTYDISIRWYTYDISFRWYTLLYRLICVLFSSLLVGPDMCSTLHIAVCKKIVNKTQKQKPKRLR